MKSAKQIETYVARTFPGLRAQVSYHKAGRGSVQVRDEARSPAKVVIDIDTRLGEGGMHRITLGRIGESVRAEWAPRMVIDPEKLRAALARVAQVSSPVGEG